VRAGFLASPAFADVTGLSTLEKQGHTIRSVPQDLKVTVISSGTLRLHDRPVGSPEPPEA
jgi:hypothetical protein